MEIIQPVKQVFMAELPRSEPVVRDHTCEIKAKTCKRLYFYTMVLGYRERQNAIYLNWGIAYHKFREILEQTKDVRPAAAAVIEFWQKEQGDPPVGTKWDFMTLERLIASCKAGYQWWLKEKELGRIEVLPDFIEKQLVVTLKDGETKIGAKVDQLVRWMGRLWGRDFKTTSKLGKYYERTLEPNDQFMRQSLIETRLTGEEVQGILVEVMYNTKKEGPEVKPYMTSRTVEQMNAWEEDQIFLSQELARNRAEDRWPMEEKHCSYCPFRQVCSAPNEKGMIAELKAHYEHKPWSFFGESDENGDASVAE